MAYRRLLQNDLPSLHREGSGGLPLVFLLVVLVVVSSLFSVEEAMRLYGAGRLVEARQMLEAITRTEPTNFDAHFRLGLVALDSHDLPIAETSLNRASHLRPDDARVWLALAQTLSKSKKKRSAAEAATKAETFANQDPVTLHGLALFHSEAGNWAKAADLERRYAAKATGDPDAVVRAVEFYLRASQPKLAIELAKKTLAKERRADLHNLLGKAYEADGQFEKTIVELQKAIQLAPREEAYVFDLAYVLLVHQNFDVAIQFLEPARKIFDRSAQLELALGVANYGQRKFPEAVDSFLRSAELAPKNEQPHVFLGRILNHAEGRLDEVTARFASFVKTNPESYLGYFLQAKGLIAQMGPSPSGEQAVQAERLLQKSISLNRNFWESEFELGVLLEGRRDFAAAATHLKRAAQLNPGMPAPHYRLARVYDRLGKTDAAQAERALHEKAAAEEQSAVERHAAGLRRLELMVK